MGHSRGHLLTRLLLRPDERSYLYGLGCRRTLSCIFVDKANRGTSSHRQQRELERLLN